MRASRIHRQPVQLQRVYESVSDLRALLLPRVPRRGADPRVHRGAGGRAGAAAGAAVRRAVPRHVAGGFLGRRWNLVAGGMLRATVIRSGLDLKAIDEYYVVLRFLRKSFNSI
ncbi:hypothetical protein SASPL_156102 [Salvia splendens]|uniref:Uncharacterized protein n=1 Tax=Salvia splendens TaxID=180675 RepID=A0A8X8VX59_SALSN|nr:hypothetical protein SASPL_156102 [Salvia splendens]